MSKQLVEQKYQPQIETILQKNQLQLFEINWIHEYESNVLQILVENLDVKIKTIDFDNLIAANEAISALLDSEEEFSEPYILEVASAGAERQVKTKETLINNLNQYFFVSAQKSYEGVTEFNATLTSYDYSTDTFTFNFFIKGKPKKAILKFSEINFIRFAIKF